MLLFTIELARRLEGTKITPGIARTRMMPRAPAAEERNVSRAAKRLLLSQPAVSRVLQRMRDTFHDDLLVRTAKGYEPTPQGERVLQELEIMLPKLDRLISGSTFDPKIEHCSFRIAATDIATSIIARVLSLRPRQAVTTLASCLLMSTSRFGSFPVFRASRHEIRKHPLSNLVLENLLDIVQVVKVEETLRHLPQPFTVRPEPLEPLNQPTLSQTIDDRLGVDPAHVRYALY